MWNHWTTEYVKALRERQIQKKTGNVMVKEGDVMIIKGDENILIEGKDGVIRGVELRAEKGVMERPVQHVYPLELRTETKQLNTKAEQFKPESMVGKPSRVAKETAKQ